MDICGLNEGCVIVFNRVLFDSKLIFFLDVVVVIVFKIFIIGEIILNFKIMRFWFIVFLG